MLHDEINSLTPVVAKRGVIKMVDGKPFIRIVNNSETD